MVIKLWWLQKRRSVYDHIQQRKEENSDSLIINCAFIFCWSVNELVLQASLLEHFSKQKLCLLIFLFIGIFSPAKAMKSSLRTFMILRGWSLWWSPCFPLAPPTGPFSSISLVAWSYPKLRWWTLYNPKHQHVGVNI